MDVPWLSGLQIKSVSSFAALMCISFSGWSQREPRDAFFGELLQMPKYWQRLLFLFFSPWLPVIWMKKPVANFPAQAYFPWDSPSGFQCHIVVPAAWDSWKLSGTGVFFIYFSVTPVSSEHWFLLTPPSCSLICPRGVIWGILSCSSSLGAQREAILVCKMWNVSQR